MTSISTKGLMKHHSIHCVDKVDRSRYANSPFKHWILTCNQHKGETGTQFIINELAQKGTQIEKISIRGDVSFKGKVRVGDVKWKERDSDSYVKGEVKTSKISGRGSGGVWFNQIRTEHEEWQNLFLVAVFPYEVRMWDLPRKIALEIATEKSSHSSQSGLVGIRCSVSKLWKLDDYLIATIPSDEIEVIL